MFKRIKESTTKIPKNMLAVVKFCPHGGMDGHFVTTDQLVRFSNRIGEKYIDKVIPLKNIQHLWFACPDCDGKPDKVDMNNTVYWETEKGSHGWCCPTCGMVVQWG